MSVRHLMFRQSLWPVSNVRKNLPNIAFPAVLVEDFDIFGFNAN